MAHYSRREWLLYKDGLLPEEVREAMEGHLRFCEKCLDTYLSAFERQDEVKAAAVLSPDFSARVARRLASLSGRPSPRTVFGTAPLTRSLLYYTIAAAITLLLLAGGWFDLLAQGAARSPEKITLLTQNIEEKIPTGWSERLVDRATGGLAAIINIKEGAEANGKE